MQTLFDFIPSNWLEALGWTVLHSLWQGALIAIVLVALFAFVPRSASLTRYRMALAGLVVMAIWAIGTFFTYPVNEVSLEMSHTVILSEGTLYCQHVHPRKLAGPADGICRAARDLDSLDLATGYSGTEHPVDGKHGLPPPSEDTSCGCGPEGVETHHA